MLNPSVKNLNLLLGIGQIDHKAAGLSQTAGKATGRQFANVLELLLQGGKANNARMMTNLMPFDGKVKSATSDESDILYQKSVLSDLSEKLGAGVRKAVKISLISGELTKPDPTTNAESQAAPSDNLLLSNISRQPLTIKDSGQPHSATTRLSDIDSNTGVRAARLEAGTLIPNQHLASVLEGRMTPVDLVAGDYAVKDARLEGGQLILEVETLDKQQIKVILPADLVAKAGEKLQVRSDATSSIRDPRMARVPLGFGTDNKGARLKDLFSKLELKELRISDTDPVLKTASRATDPQKPVEVRLVAVQSGEEIVIKQRLKKDQIRAELRQSPGKSDGYRPRSTTTNIGRGTPAAVRPNTVNPGTPNQVRSGTPIDMVGSKIILDKESSPLETSGGSRQGTLDLSADIVNLDRPADTQLKTDATTSTRNVTPTAKYLFDENLAARLKPNGKSVSINIEPEHLGPARLRLSLHNEVLTARLTVESPQAKAAVESSLDQLTDQLARAGIRVNQVEVSVHGGDIDGWRFEQGPMSDRLPNGGRRRVSGEPVGEIAERDETEPYRIPTYIRPDQVNVFA